MTHSTHTHTHTHTLLTLPTWILTFQQKNIGVIHWSRPTECIWSPYILGLSGSSRVASVLLFTQRLSSEMGTVPTSTRPQSQQRTAWCASVLLISLRDRALGLTFAPWSPLSLCFRHCMTTLIWDDERRASAFFLSLFRTDGFALAPVMMPRSSCVSFSFSEVLELSSEHS